MRVLSCGVIVTDGRHLLIGHASHSPRWDIPKGQAETGEAPIEAARRELLEETGLEVDTTDLAPLGLHAYLPRKDLELYVWRLDTMPDPALLVCRSFFERGGREIAEFDRFACPPWSEAMAMVGKSMQTVLQTLERSRINLGHTLHA